MDNVKSESGQIDIEDTFTYILVDILATDLEEITSEIQGDHTNVL